MDDFWAYVLNSVQEVEFRLEDIMLHSLSGFFVVLTLRIKAVIKKIKKAFSNFFKRFHNLKSKIK